MNIGLGRHAQLSVAAGPVQADKAKIHAAIGLAVAAGVAVATTHDRLNHHKVAALEPTDLATHFHNCAADFVAADQRILRIRIASTVMLHVARADAGRDGTNEHVSRAAAGRRPLADLELLRGFEDDRLHAFSSGQSPGLRTTLSPIFSPRFFNSACNRWTSRRSELVSGLM